MRQQLSLFKENKMKKNELAKKVAEQNHLTVKAATAALPQKA